MESEPAVETRARRSRVRTAMILVPLLAFVALAASFVLRLPWEATCDARMVSVIDYGGDGGGGTSRIRAALGALKASGYHRAHPDIEVTDLRAAVADAIGGDTLDDGMIAMPSIEGEPSVTVTKTSSGRWRGDGASFCTTFES